MLASTLVSHPFTYLRWLRMIDKARTKTREQWWNTAVVPQLLTIERCLALYYQAAVGTVQATTPAAIEWRFQRAALETLARYRLVPPHLFIAMRCAREGLSRGRIPNEEEVVASAKLADRELEGAGARALHAYRSPLSEVAGAMSQRALEDVRMLGTETMTAIVDRLADAFLLDARTRYPAGTVQKRGN